LQILPPAPIAHSFTVDPGITVCYGGGELCAICLDSHITNIANLDLTLSVSPTSAAGGTVEVTAIGGCTCGVAYISSLSTGANQPDSFGYSIKDIYNRVSSATVSLTTAND
jgi:hypothetical protein